MKTLRSAIALILLAATAARADDAALLDVARRYADGGDLSDAKKSVGEKNAAQLLKALRSVAPKEKGEPGDHKESLEDDHGTKTDLFVVAPSSDEIAAAEKDGGLVTIVALHGLGGNGRQLLPVSRSIAPKGRTLILAPTAQKIPQGLENDDVPIFDIGSPHWWVYKSARSFPLEALRLARRKYPIDPDRVFLIGYSMGGFGSWNIGLRYVDRFAGIAPCAGGLSRREMLVEKDERARRLLVNARLAPFWFTHGDADETVPVNLDRKLHKALDALSIPHQYEEIPGGHHILPIAAGAGNAPSLAEFLKTKRRESSPRSIEFDSAGDFSDGAYWLRIAKRATADADVKLQGEIDAKHNAIAVSIEGPAQAIDVYLDDRLLDLSKPVTIEVKGQNRWKGIAKPDVEAILDSWKSREDPRLVYPARVRFELQKTFR